MKKEYWINVKHVDNRMVIFLNGNTIWDSGIVHDDPELDHYINITEELLAHPNHTNELIFEGYNDTYNSNGEGLEVNPWHFHYRAVVKTIDDKGNLVSEGNMIEPYNQKHLSNPNIRAINNKYDFIKKDGEFKVISNSLTQNFYK